MRVSILAASLACCLLSPSACLAADPVLHWELPETSGAAELRIALPDGTVRAWSFAAGEAPRVVLDDRAEWPAGSYAWELWMGPVLDEAARERLRSLRAGSLDATVAPAVSPLRPLSGGFRLDGGGTLLQGGNAVEEPSTAAKDVVVPDDQIVQGSLCVGTACVVDENFGFDTIRMRENNLRIAFDDTSASPGFAANDWALVANDSDSGGIDRFSIEDVTNARVPFTVRAGAPTNAMVVDSSGQLGLHTSTPMKDVHLATGDTPTLRLDQTNAGGYTPQTWDIGGNEANFFVRDVTGGSQLSLRIRRGAPTSSIDIAGNGDVGFGTALPAAPLHVDRDAARDVLMLVEAPLRAGDAAALPTLSADTRMRLDGNGNLYVGGTVAQLSSRSAKENFVAIDPVDLLARIAALPISTWNYRDADAGDRHLGPVAEDFHRAFGLGQSERQMAPSDVAGVALAAAQALQRQVVDRDRQIARLEARLARLEALLEPASTAAR